MTTFCHPEGRPEGAAFPGKPLTCAYSTTIRNFYGENVTVEVMDMICTNLNSSINDIPEIIPSFPGNRTDSDVK
jgi:hypothetical protein